MIDVNAWDIVWYNHASVEHGRFTMVARFVEPDTRALLGAVVHMAYVLDGYRGEPITPGHPLSMCQFWLAYYSISTNSPHQPERMVRPLSRLWRMIVYASNNGLPCYLPSQWPDLQMTDSSAANPKLARDWRDILCKYMRAFRQIVSSGRYEKLVRSIDSRRAEAIIEQWLDASAGYGVRVEE